MYQFGNLKIMKLEVRGRGSEVRESEIRNLHSKILNPKSEICIPKSEICIPKSEIRNLKFTEDLSRNHNFLYFRSSFIYLS
jgi:hypothetical protein